MAYVLGTYVCGAIIAALLAGVDSDRLEPFWPKHYPPQWAAVLFWPLMLAVAVLAGFGLVVRWAFDTLVRSR